MGLDLPCPTTLQLQASVVGRYDGVEKRGADARFGAPPPFFFFFGRAGTQHEIAGTHSPP